MGHGLQLCLYPCTQVSGETQGETRQLEAGAGLKDAVGLGHAELREQMVKWHMERKKSIPVGIQLSNYLKFVCLAKC